MQKKNWLNQSKKEQDKYKKKNLGVSTFIMPKKLMSNDHYS